MFFSTLELHASSNWRATVHVWAIRLAVYIIRLIIFTAVHYVWSLALGGSMLEAPRKSELPFYRRMSCAKLYEILCLKHTKMNETKSKSFSIRNLCM